MLGRGAALLSAAWVISATAALAHNPLTHFDSSIEREKQIELAMSAAPKEVATDATIYILGPKGYQIAQPGTNGFSCIVDREYASHSVEPECFDAEGSETLLLVRFKVEELRAQGVSEEAIKKEIDAGYKSGTYKPPRRPGIVYMLSDNNQVFDPGTKRFVHFPRHLMFYAPYMTDHDLGYKSPATLPYLVNPGRPDTLMIVVPAAHGDTRSHRHGQP